MSRKLRIAAFVAGIVLLLFILDEVRLALVRPGMSERTLNLLVGRPSKVYSGPHFPATFSPRSRIGCADETAALQIYSRTWSLRPSLVVAISEDRKVACSERIFVVSFTQY